MYPLADLTVVPVGYETSVDGVVVKTVYDGWAIVDKNGNVDYIWDEEYWPQDETCPNAGENDIPEYEGEGVEGEDYVISPITGKKLGVEPCDPVRIGYPPIPGFAKGLKYIRIIKLFKKYGIRISTHAAFRILQRSVRGISFSNVLEAYRKGRLFYNPVTGNYIRHCSRTGVSVAINKIKNGKIVTVFEGNISPTWIPIKYRPN